MKTKRYPRVRMSMLSAVIALAAGSAWGQTVIRVSTTGNDANNGSSWTLAKKTVQAGLTAAVSGDQVWVAAGTYVERITLNPDYSLRASVLRPPCGLNYGW